MVGGGGRGMQNGGVGVGEGGEEGGYFETPARSHEEKVTENERRYLS